MLASTEPACLLIADISGYTGYLATVELEHAQDILADLVDTVVNSLRPAFRLAKLEGDAAYSDWERQVAASLAALEPIIRDEAMRRTHPADEEPPLPTSQERFLGDPVT